MHTHIDGSRTVRLRPGHPVRLYADAGMHILAGMGRVVVGEAPAWLSDQLGVSAKLFASRRPSAALARILARLRCFKWSL